MKWPSWRPWGKWALFGALISAAVVVMGSDEEHGPAKLGRAKLQHVAPASPHPVEAAKLHSSAARVEFEHLLRQKQQSGGGMEVGNAFNATSWYVQPPPPPALPPPPPPEPVAPPLPFIYLGHYQNPDSPARVIILAWADRVFTVSEGEVIDGTYRIGPVAADMLEITYLPLNIRQTLKMDGMS